MKYNTSYRCWPISCIGYNFIRCPNRPLDVKLRSPYCIIANTVNFGCRTSASGNAICNAKHKTGNIDYNPLVSIASSTVDKLQPFIGEVMTRCWKTLFSIQIISFINSRYNSLRNNPSINVGIAGATTESHCYNTSRGIHGHITV